MMQTTKSEGVISTAVSFVAGYVNRACRFAVEEFLARGISKGSLTLVHADEGGRETVFGETAAAAAAGGRAVARITVCDSGSFYQRVATSADIGFAEAYMGGDFDASGDELLAVFYVLIANRDGGGLQASGLGPARAGRWANGALHWLNRNSEAGSARNIAAHYDLSNEVFGTFLGRTWTYSCGFFDGGVPAAQRTLDRAQEHKLDMVAGLARVDRACHVLEIGCGWGEWAIRAAQTRGCRVTGITLSVEQLAFARARAAEAGVSDRVAFELADYRALARRGAAFDRVVSIEMAEAVGHEFLPEFFRAVAGALRPGGLAALQVITTPEERYGAYRASPDFVQKHVFPGGVCPSVSALVGAAGEAGLSLEAAQNIGVHYAATLAEWRRSFERALATGAFDRARARAGLPTQLNRKWGYYLAYCQAGFATRTLGAHQLLLTRGGNTRTLGGPPASAASVARPAARGK